MHFKNSEEKLAHIVDTPVYIKQFKDSTLFHASLPCDISSSVEPSVKDPHILYIHNIHVGDPELRRKGIGTRLVRSIVRYGLENDPEITGIEAVGTNLALAKTFMQAFGEDHVRVDYTRHQSYGAGQPANVHELLDTIPPASLADTHIWGVFANIDPRSAREWELPISTPRQD
jgi:hypothetical protein